MAWYLLGKEYERLGKAGKALYCYQQSQEVYEAFEKKSLPKLAPLPEAGNGRKNSEGIGARIAAYNDEGITEYNGEGAPYNDEGIAAFNGERTASYNSEGTVNEGSGKEKSRTAGSFESAMLKSSEHSSYASAVSDEAEVQSSTRRLRIIGRAVGNQIRRGWPRGQKNTFIVVVLLLLFLAMPPADTVKRPALDDSRTVWQERIEVEGPGAKFNEPSANSVSNTGERNWNYRLVWLKEQFAQQPGEIAFMLPGNRIQQETAWALLPKSDSWYLWGERTKLFAAMRPSEQQGEWLIQYYEEEYCKCEPPDKKELSSQVAEQMALEEQRLALKSALAAYKDFNGRFPSSFEQISRDYPDNLLSSFTEEMREAFAPLLDELEEADSTDEQAGMDESDGTGEPDGHSNSAEGYVQGILDEPLEILVDVNNHRLALVSGDVVIRNYPVGLGGDRTPEGEYVISEKVVNPRGKNKGEFGSRGMTLSDTLYAIHGTNQPSSIGLDQSLGCVRMLEEDLQELYSFASKGTKVRIGSFDLPEEVVRGTEPFLLPVVHNEENPDRIYRWLN
ncbi:L,D-transpeptidase [Paenibacillus senegalensis]|uniref:L,D-transpeptidase n=1 Tax=Paenibacillus senegalensis TaxID=1465766 RepID=UPI001F433A8B|nr:L,D-transpeptidase [Paenibacillus senegalensis]